MFCSKTTLLYLILFVDCQPLFALANDMNLMQRNHDIVTMQGHANREHLIPFYLFVLNALNGSLLTSTPTVIGISGSVVCSLLSCIDKKELAHHLKTLGLCILCTQWRHFTAEHSSDLTNYKAHYIRLKV